MKTKFFVIFLMIFTSYCININAQTLAFPGAEGFGRFARGARANSTPEIYHVTNLNDSGTGSFRDAISQPNRFIVFDVSGVINIKDRLVFSKNLTIAGQTAPGDGVVIYGNGVSFSAAEDIIVRHLRLRMGIGGDSGKDAAGIANGKNMIFDHVSVTWGKDENFSINWDSKGTEPTNITIQNSIIGQGIMVHSAGGLIQTAGGVTLFRNLYIDNKTRNPKVKGLNQFVNNVVYNWGSGGGYILGGESEGPSWGTIENNYFVKGPDTGSTEAFVRGNENFQVFHQGNMLDYTTNGVLDGTLGDGDVFGPVTLVASYDNFQNAPQYHPTISAISTAEDSYNWIVKNAGASLPQRDAVDTYLIDELTSLGTKGALINGETDLGLPNAIGYVFSSTQQLDSDNDGIPDEWEDAHGLNKNDPSDALILNGDYYNIEHYINSINAGIPFVKYPTRLYVGGVDSNYIIINWNNNAELATGVVIEVSTDKTFTDKTQYVLAPTATSYKIEGLKASTSYYVRLKTVNDSYESLYSDVLTSKTTGEAAPPIASTNPVPSNNSLISEYLNTVLKWENFSGTWGGLLYYTVYIGTSEGNLTKVATKITSTQVSTTIESNTKYYWRVDTENYLGTNTGDVWSFTSGSKPEREKVAYWPLNESSGNSAVNDVMGYATAKDFTPEWMTGKIGNCVNFPGIASAGFVQDHYDAISLGNESFTIELWFKSSGGSVDHYLIHKGSHTKNTSTGNTGKWFGVQYQKNSKNDRLTWGVDDDVTKSVADVSSASTYFNNEWTHLVCIRDVEKKKLRVYINGALKQESTDNTGDIAETESIVIGNTNVLFVNGFKGGIDEVSIYKGVLTAEEILDNYKDGINTSIHNTTSSNGKDVSVFPNPFVDELHITLPESVVNQPASVKIYSLSGQLVFAESLNVTESQIKLTGLGGLTSGVYLCEVTAGQDVRRTIKIIK